MADDPIVIDDGGSTRIKLMLKSGAIGEMDGLLNVSRLANAGRPYDGTNGSQVNIEAKGRPPKYSKLIVTYIDSFGTAFTKTFDDFKMFRVQSGDQNIFGEAVEKAGRVDIQLTAYSAGCEPMVDAKQGKGKRRYVVTNAPAINEVWVDGATVFELRAPFEVAGVKTEGSVIYTTVVVK